eukprot:TRINITY_DN3154_c0_g1_i8.p5 TRINITY_DN3154_c0_g1~~TRINITY_DN3154_c0_g1_i8.p5  ORF type:complete len:225 (+),score=-20.03 TRINITY_DN3154_c0_g1_i8:386-1060(+)
MTKLFKNNHFNKQLLKYSFKKRKGIIRSILNKIHKQFECKIATRFFTSIFLNLIKTQLKLYSNIVKVSQLLQQLKLPSSQLCQVLFFKITPFYIETNLKHVNMYSLKQLFNICNLYYLLYMLLFMICMSQSIKKQYMLYVNNQHTLLQITQFQRIFFLFIKIFLQITCLFKQLCILITTCICTSLYQRELLIYFIHILQITQRPKRHISNYYKTINIRIQNQRN